MLSWLYENEVDPSKEIVCTACMCRLQRQYQQAMASMEVLLESGQYAGKPLHPDQIEQV
jgi:hypothetical protein